MVGAGGVEWWRGWGEDGGGQGEVKGEGEGKTWGGRA